MRVGVVTFTGIAIVTAVYCVDGLFSLSFDEKVSKRSNVCLLLIKIKINNIIYRVFLPEQRTGRRKREGCCR